MFKCWWCQGKLIWDRDIDASEYFYDEERDGVCTFLNCSDCSATVLYLPPDEL